MFIRELTQVAIFVAFMSATAFSIADPSKTSASYEPTTLSAAQATADVALMRRALETIHPGLYRYSTHAEIDAAFAKLQLSASRPVTDLVLWREIALMLARIHCDHTKAEASAAIDTYRRSQGTHLPLRFRIIEGRMTVFSNDGQPDAPPPGSEIVAINGMPVPLVLTTLGHAVAYDGSTEQSIAAKLESDADLMGDDFNENWPAFYGFPASWSIQWKRPGDLRLSTSTLAPITFKDWVDLRWNGGLYRAEFYKSISWRMAPKVAYLRIDTFVNYRNPVDATSFLGGFFKSLKDSGVDHLILDLRENGGGSEDVSLALGRYLFADRFVWSKPVLLKAIRYGDLPRYMETWGDPKLLFEPPLDGFRRTSDGWWERLPRGVDEDEESVLPQNVSLDHFGGRVTVITGPRNGSGATRTIAQLREHIGAHLVGEDSAGSAEGPTAGHIFLLTLPNSGIKVRVPNAWNRTNIVNFVAGRGVGVDEPVLSTYADFEQKRDRAFEVAKNAPSQQAVTPMSTVLAGNWEGTLDYRDYVSDRRVTLPMIAAASGRGLAINLSYTFDDGPGKKVRSSESWGISADGKTLSVSQGKDREVMKIVEYRGTDATDMTLVAEGSGLENKTRVNVCFVVTRRGDNLSISRLTRQAGEPFLLRDAYRLKQRN